MQQFTVPRDVFFGHGALEHLKTIKGTRALISIGSDRLIESGVVAKVEGYLKEAGMETDLYSGITHDPTFGMAHDCAKEMEKFQPDVIVAIGGGSPIDATKAAWTFYEYPELPQEEATTPFALPELRRKAKFVAVSTTSGTGTEVTSFAVVADDESFIKYPMADFNLTPDVAIVDFDMVETLTPELVANTGMDALTHSFEAYVSPARTPFTDAMAMWSIEMIVNDIVGSYHGEKKAREEMHVAQCMAGMAFSNAILGIVHSMAHKSGKIFGVPHGCANAIYLPYVIEYNAKEAAPAYADIAARLDLEGSTEDELVTSLVQLVKDLRIQMNMPASLQEFGVPEDLFLEKLPVIAPAAVGDPCTGTNPRKVTPEQMTELFKCVYYGKEVDF